MTSLNHSMWEWICPLPGFARPCFFHQVELSSPEDKSIYARMNVPGISYFLMKWYHMAFMCKYVLFQRSLLWKRKRLESERGGIYACFPSSLNWIYNHLWSGLIHVCEISPLCKSAGSLIESSFIFPPSDKAHTVLCSILTPIYLLLQICI